MHTNRFNMLNFDELLSVTTLVSIVFGRILDTIFISFKSSFRNNNKRGHC